MYSTKGIGNELYFNDVNPYLFLTIKVMVSMSGHNAIRYISVTSVHGCFASSLLGMLLSKCQWANTALLLCTKSVFPSLGKVKAIFLSLNIDTLLYYRCLARLLVLTETVFSLGFNK